MRPYVIAGSFVLSRAHVGEIRVGKLRKCAAAVLIGVLDAGYGMHTYGAFSHIIAWRRNAPHYCSKISEYLTCGGDPYPEGVVCALVVVCVCGLFVE